MEDDLELSLEASLPADNDFFPALPSSSSEQAANEAEVRRRLENLLRILDR